MSRRPKATKVTEKEERPQNPPAPRRKLHVPQTNHEEPKVMNMLAFPKCASELPREVSYTDIKYVGSGTFGVVYQAKLCDTGEIIAVKKVLQEKRFKNRELDMMRMLEHCNVVQLKYYFYSDGAKEGEMYLNMIMEYVPKTLYRVIRHYTKAKQLVPTIYVKLYSYQLFRSLAYIHSLGICHRDIKPENVLLNTETGVLKLCDFGSSKYLIKGQENISYICSRYYRAPELVFGAINYSTQIDVWSAGCVLAELMLGRPIFPGESAVDQLVKIIKYLGTPTKDQIREMNPSYKDFKYPQVKASSWLKVFSTRTPLSAINLVASLLKYSPDSRLKPQQVCTDPFYNELRDSSKRLPNGNVLPPLFNLSEHELSFHSRFGHSLRAQLPSTPSSPSPPPKPKHKRKKISNKADASASSRRR